MSEQNPTPEATPSSEKPSSSDRCERGHGRRRGRWGRKLGFLTILVLGVFALPRAFGWGGGHHCRGDAAWTSEGVREHMSVMSDRALDAVDANDQQYAQIEAILDEAAPRVAGNHEEARALKQRFRETLVKDPTDRAALESVRAEAIALADRASREALDDLSEAAAVLTPEQRAQLADKLSRHWGPEDKPE